MLAIQYSIFNIQPSILTHGCITYGPQSQFTYSYSTPEQSISLPSVSGRPSTWALLSWSNRQSLLPGGLAGRILRNLKYRILQATMATLLDLPRELRDHIWSYCLVSPTRCIEPISRSVAFYSQFPRSASPSGPQFYLAIKDPETHDSCLLTGTRPEFISLSLPRTCRTIYLETTELFWKSNTFFFPSAVDLLHSFRDMGRIPSRCITSLSISICTIEGNAVEVIEKALRRLVQSAPRSSLERLDLVLSRKSLEAIARARLSMLGGRGSVRSRNALRYGEFLFALEETSRANAFKRRLILHNDATIPIEAVCMDARDTIQELHQKWRGQVYWGGNLILDEMQTIGLLESDEATGDGNA